MKKDKVIISNNIDETKKTAENLVKKLKNGDILALYGDLGGGKTTFVQGLAKGLGIKKRIISPTFVIIRSYKVGFKNFYHIDLYRVEDKKDLESLGIMEIINNPENIVVIEWAEKLEKFLPKKRINIYFTYEGEEKRKIRIIYAN